MAVIYHPYDLFHGYQGVRIYFPHAADRLCPLCGTAMRPGQALAGHLTDAGDRCHAFHGSCLSERLHRAWRCPACGIVLEPEQPGQPQASTVVLCTFQAA